MNFCTECGNKIREGQFFCTGCGRKLEFKGEKKPEKELMPGPNHSSEKTVEPWNNHYPSHEVQEYRRYRKKKNWAGAIISSVIVLGLVTGGVYYFLSKDKVDEVSTVEIQERAEASDELNESVNTGIKEDVQADVEETNSIVETDVVNRALEELRNLSVDVEGLDISVGEWEIQEVNGSLLAGASNIPEHELEKIFNLYDNRDWKPLKDWAKEVFYIVSDLGAAKNMEWSIFVGNNCAAPYPKTLPSDFIIENSGSCGYSIPVLSGNNEENFTMVLNEKVFSSDNHVVEDSSFIFPDSSVRRLTEPEILMLTKHELSIARNEIFARYGYVFNSFELQDYFSKKTWYRPNPYYDSSLNEIETFNVELIKKREEQLQ